MTLVQGPKNPSGSRPREVLIAEVLERILDAVAAMPDSPQKRSLGAKAEGYKRALEQWLVTPPTEAQRNAFCDVVLSLHAKLREIMRRDTLELTPCGGIPLRFDRNDA